ncbi:ChrR family anti-sigma-E factor [Aestuariivirga sp.]|uniref:ChrR family anti-sigma-E factor n=1 Tax=Aestuariivirga sp. TaxID=2650926 RepID=UPI0025C4D1A3|nr:ChrR family anti-sigma-E factor [Aestuariivirga sp.]MCA3554791.1 cupin domain-containing protein [Aestuariivirga sp.]
MIPNHHLDDSTLLAYAAGTLGEAFSVVATAHVAVCPACRSGMRAAEALGGEFLEGAGVEAVSDDCRNRTFAALEQAGLYRLPVPAPRAAVPRPLAGLLPVSSLDELGWKTKAPGVAIFEVKLGSSAQGRLRLLRIGAGRAMPEHGHGGEEITMVLKGAYVDHMGRFAAGDVADLDEEIEHRPVVERDGDCICLVATERPTRFKSLAARLLQPFVGI